jgi:hypothetical protein
MKIEIIFLIVLTIIIAYIFVLYSPSAYTPLRGYKVEKMGDTSSTVDQIKEAVKQIYLADVEAIRNLSAVATKLQADGLTVPAHMNIKGKLNIGSDANAKDLPSLIGLSVNNTEDAAIRLKTKADDKKNVLLINKDGNFRINNANSDFFGVNQDGHTYNIHTGDHVHHFVGRGENPYITISKEGEWDNKSWYMQNVKNDGTNKIFRIGVHGEGPKLDIHRNGNAFFTGDITIPKNVNVSGLVLQKRNKAKLIKVGNLDPTIAKDHWTLIELRAYDHAGNNVAQGKPVSIVQGSAYGGTPPGNITDGRIFNAPNQLHDNWNLGYHGNPGINALQIDLGAEIDLAEIVLFNRWDASYDWRMDGTTIELIGADNIRNRIIHTGLWHRQYSKEYLL